MVINNGGNLSVDYFKAYFGLIMSAKNTDLDEAKEIAYSRLFQNHEGSLGDISYKNYLQAYSELKNVKGS